MKWIKHNNSIVYSENDTRYINKNIKLAGFDLDHTLIRPLNKRIHPKDKNDYELVFSDLKKKLLRLHNNGYTIIIFSNQSSFEKKKDIIISRIEKLNNYLIDSVPLQIFISISNDFNRKPNTGMLDFFLSQNKLTLNKNSFYVGDAAGRIESINYKRDFSCSDRMFALNTGLNFYTPETFYNNNEKREFEIKNIGLNCFMKEEPKIEMYIKFSEINKHDVILLIGSPCSGRTTFANFLKDKFNYNVINLENYRTKNKCLSKIKELSSKKIVIDMCLTKKSLRKIYFDLLSPESKVLGLIFDVDKIQSLFLNNYKCKKEKKNKLNDVVIHSYFKYYEPISLNERFDTIMRIPFIPNFKNNNINKKLFYEFF